MLIKDIYAFVQLLKRQGHSQYFSPEEVIGQAFNRASLDLFTDEHRLFEKTGRVGDNLRNFKQVVDITRNNDTGLFNLPNGKEEPPLKEYFHWTNVASLITTGTGDNAVTQEYRGKVYTDGEWIEANTSSLLPPEEKNCQVRVVKGGLEVKPTSLNKIRLYYLTKPEKAVYAYDPDNNKITFKETGSTDPDWPITAHKFLIMRTLKYLGISMTDPVMIQAEEMIKSPSNVPE